MLSITHWPYVYFLSLAALLAAVGIYCRLSRNEERAISLILLIASTILTAIKAPGVGADDFVYDRYFSEGSIFALDVEPLFTLLVFIFHHLGFGITEFAILTNVVFVIGAIRLCNYFQVSFAFWILGYAAFGSFFEITYDHIRNGLSLGITMCFLPFLFERKYVMYFAGVAASVFMHFSGIVFLFLPFVLKAKINLTSVTLVLLGTVLITNFNFYIMIFDQLNRFTGLGLDALIIRVQSKDLESEFAAGFNWSLFGVLKYVIAVAAAIKFRKSEELRTVLKVYIYGIFLWALFHEIGIFSGRFWRSISVFEPILMFFLLESIKPKLVVAITIVLFFLYAGIKFIPERSQPYELALIGALGNLRFAVLSRMIT